ncbi:MAG: glycosyltransferase [Candidatus Falkowbacteria bacterium]
MKKIDFFIPNFDDLGAQMVAINVANSLSSNFHIKFIVFLADGKFRNLLNSDIGVVELDRGWLNFGKVKVINRFLQYRAYSKKSKTDIVISFSPMTNIVALFAKFFNRHLKVVIQEHCFPSLAIKDRQNLSFFWALMFKMVFFRMYNYSDIFITISEAIKIDFVNNFKVRADVIKIVRNPININKIILNSKEVVSEFNFFDNKKYLIVVGRLVDQKNFSRLLDIFDLIRKKRQDVELIILGQGANRDALIKKANDLKLDAVTHFLGFNSNPYKFMARADCFCLTSVWEGLPQVLAEAMICKVPVISVDCNSGPREMIINGVSGYLIKQDDNNEFVQRVCEILDDEHLRLDIASKAYDFAVAEYSIEKCSKKYLEIIDLIS